MAKNCDVKVTLIGAGFTEEAGVFKIDEYGQFFAIVERLEDTLKMIALIRPEMHSVVLQFKGYSMTKTLETVRMENEEANRKEEEGYRDSWNKDK